MKNLISILLLLTGLLVSSILPAQKLSNPLIVGPGEAYSFGGTSVDSLIAGDTVDYYFKVQAPERIHGVIQLNYTKATGSQTTNITVLASLDNVDSHFTAVKKGKASVDWASGALTNTGIVFFDTERDTVAFNKRYYKIRAISTGASSKGKLSGYIKTYKN
jgi:hypothetical protein